MHVVIVEDEEILAKVLKEKLEKEKFNVSLAGDGDAAISLVNKVNPDIVILDLILPKKDGFEVLKELKSNARLKQIPVVVLSNLGQDQEIKRALSLGAADYLVKTQHPIKEVMEKVKEQLMKGR